ncbi:MAG: GNAT family N-acetyltransferase [Alphaproteobacteria bacterium]|nr:GNAT family N-acetyltransferase [Alphaproteobacteria bacterium]
MNNSFTLRRARPDEASEITALMLRSKAHWGYSKEFMELCVDTLYMDPKIIESDAVIVAVSDEEGRLLGVQHVIANPPIASLDKLFVDAIAIGSGVGAALYADAVVRAKAAACTRMTVLSDPHAAPFYETRGAIKTGEVASDAIPGRMLPFLEHVF